MTELPNGTVVLRRVRTGYKRSDEYDRLDYTLYHLAARARYGAAYVVEALHLTDESVEAVAVSATKMNHRRAKSEDLLAGITAGRFSPDMDAVRCPRCPHFFICAATHAAPSGSLKESCSPAFWNCAPSAINGVKGRTQA